MKKQKRKSKKIGQAWEVKVQKSINSGSLWFSKGDLLTPTRLIECKYTSKKGYRITSKILEKLWEEALDSNKLPVLIIGIENDKEIWKLVVHIEKEVK